MKIIKENQKIIILAGLFIILILLTKIPIINTIDTSFSFVVYNFFNNSIITEIFNLITSYSLALIFIIFALVIYIKNKNIYKLLFFATSVLIQSVSVNLIQTIIHRTRPFLNSNTVTYLGSNAPVAFSFPSGHSTFAFFLAYLGVNILNLNKKFRIIIYLLAFLIALSRIYLGAHYILDVVGGSVLGLMLGMIAFKVYLKIFK